ncbi:MAG TPA: alpha/beta hydrolase [Coleofasciculaceae cyanobacterium]
MKSALGLWMVPIASVVLTASSALAADRVTISYGLLERSISINSLDIYAKEGRITEDFEKYTRYLNPDQLLQLRQILLAKSDLSSVAVSQFLYTDQGEVLLNRLSEVIRTETNLPGFYAIRAALILAAAEPDGLTVVNVLKQFPLTSVRIDLGRSLKILGDLEILIRQTQNAIALIQQQAALEAQDVASVPLLTLPDLRSPGSFTWDTYTLQLRDRKRDRAFPVDVYVPKTGHPAPLIVISHGLGSDRSSYAYLARQLASYGLAVAVPEHPGSNTNQLKALVSGRANQVTEPAEFINRPLDIKFLLDVLMRRSRNDPRFAGRIDPQQVGVVGQSFGGYTALALAGAQLDFTQLIADCAPTDTFNLSLLLQCRATELPQPIPDLHDDRVKAIIAINPIGSSLFGEQDFANIQIPVMLISGGADTVAPALLEQIRPFTWLQTPDKYLMLITRGTHFSTIDVPNPNDKVLALPPDIVGPSPELAHTYLEAISVAFFGTYVANQSRYRPYLRSAYVHLLSQPALPVDLVQSLTPDQLAKVERGQTAEAIAPDFNSNTWTGSQP